MMHGNMNIKYCPNKFTTFSKQENNAPQQAFKLNSAPKAPENLAFKSVYVKG